MILLQTLKLKLFVRVKFWLKMAPKLSTGKLMVTFFVNLVRQNFSVKNLVRPTQNSSTGVAQQSILKLGENESMSLTSDFFLLIFNLTSTVLKLPF